MFRAFFCEVHDIDHPLVLKETLLITTWQAVQKKRIPSYNFFIIYASNYFLCPFLFYCVYCSIGLRSLPWEKMNSSCLPFVSWNSSTINCLSTMGITETSEGHMGCNNPFASKKKKWMNERRNFCHRIAQYILRKKDAFPIAGDMCVFFHYFLPGKKPLSWEHEKYNTWYVSVHWREERESHVSTFSLQSSQNVYLSAFEDWNNPKRKFITELKFLGS